MTTTSRLKHKKSFSNKLRETCSNVVHSLKQISNAVLLSSESNNCIDDLFDSSNDSDQPYYTNQFTYGDFESALRRENFNLDSFQQKNQFLQPILDTTVESTQIGSFTSMNKTDSSFSMNSNSNSTTNSTTNSNSNIDGFKLWEKQRNDWLIQTQSNDQISIRKSNNSLTKLTAQHDDVYINIYRNLVQQGKPLKKGINMIDGFKVIHSGWEHNKLYERIADGGIP